MATPLPQDPFPPKWGFAAVRGWFEHRLEGRPLPEIQLLAGRAALRSLPLLRGLLDIPGKKRENPARAILLACLRGYPISVGAALVPPTEIERFRSAAATAADSATYSVAAADSADSAATAAYSAARSAVRSATADSAAAYSAAAYSVAAAAAAAAYSAATAVDSAARSAAAAAAFEQDRRILDAGGVERLARARLWPALDAAVLAAFAGRFGAANYRGGMPPALRPARIAMNRALRTLEGDFAVWADWYDGILQGEKAGRFVFGLPTARALRLTIEIALIDKALWQNPAGVHAEIRRLVEAARGEEGEKPREGASDAPRSGATANDLPRSDKKREQKKTKLEPKTRLGINILANAEHLALLTHSFIAVVDEELARLRDQRPNSKEEISKRDATIGLLEKLKADATGLRDAAIDFPKGEIAEQEDVQKANAFLKPFREMWSEKGKEFAEYGCRAAVFGIGSGIAILLGAQPLAATVISGAIVAAKPVAEVFRAARGVFKFF